MSKLTTELNGVADCDYAVFHSRISRTQKKLLGVRMPVLRQMAKKLSYFDLKDEDGGIYEIAMLRSLALARLSYEQILANLDDVIACWDSWAFTDAVAPSCTALRKQAERAERDLRYLLSKGTFYKRFYVVFVMTACPQNAEAIENVAALASGDYYVDMAAAWYISVLMTKDFDFSLSYLSRFSSSVQQMAIRKGMDSFRLSKEQKQILRRLRAKV